MSTTQSLFLDWRLIQKLHQQTNQTLETSHCCWWKMFQLAQNPRSHQSDLLQKCPLGWHCLWKALQKINTIHIRHGHTKNVYMLCAIIHKTKFYSFKKKNIQQVQPSLKVTYYYSKIHVDQSHQNHHRCLKELQMHVKVWNYVSQSRVTFFHWIDYHGPYCTSMIEPTEQECNLICSHKIMSQKQNKEKAYEHPQLLSS